MNQYPIRLTFRVAKELKVLLRQRAKLKKMTVGEYIRTVMDRAVRLDWGCDDSRKSHS